MKLLSRSITKMKESQPIPAIAVSLATSLVAEKALTIGFVKGFSLTSKGALFDEENRL